MEKILGQLRDSIYTAQDADIITKNMNQCLDHILDHQDVTEIVIFYKLISMIKTEEGKKFKKIIDLIRFPLKKTVKL